MQKNTNKTASKTYTLTLTKEIGTLWIIEDIKPFGKKFEKFYDEDLSHDVSKITSIGAANYVLDILAGDERRMDIELCMSAERMDVPGYVEFALVEPGHLAAKYHVNHCPGEPQLVAWISAAARQIFKEYPIFAYVKKK